MKCRFDQSQPFWDDALFHLKKKKHFRKASLLLSLKLNDIAHVSAMWPMGVLFNF